MRYLIRAFDTYVVIDRNPAIQILIPIAPNCDDFDRDRWQTDLRLLCLSDAFVELFLFELVWFWFDTLNVGA